MKGTVGVMEPENENKKRRKVLVEPVHVKLDEETHARVERLARALEARDPQMRQASRAGAVRSAMMRGLDVMEAELGIATTQ